MNSWIESANNPLCHFPVQNIPFGIAAINDGNPRCVSAIGDFVVDLSLLEAKGLLPGSGKNSVLRNPALNSFMELGT
ncbi:MAG: fumarylacetoacetase, partial [Rhizobiaceae bacterium]|nr:fumarylacetoacetase [Rhizobiaceae bacterium]